MTDDKDTAPATDDTQPPPPADAAAQAIQEALAHVAELEAAHANEMAALLEENRGLRLAADQQVHATTVQLPALERENAALRSQVETLTNAALTPDPLAVAPVESERRFNEHTGRVERFTAAGDLIP